MTVFFIGAGPGDPELLTIKGKRCIENAPVVLYAGSLIPEAILAFAQKSAAVHNTAELTLDEIIHLIQSAHSKGQDVARLQCGDPSIYGAIGEQMRRLDALNIPYEVIPGVTSASASAAALKAELTLSGVTQTVIHTRYAGKTPMPESESLAALAQHGATLVIHLGITRIHKIVDELTPFYGTTCPVAVVYRASWPDEQRIVGTLADIVAKVRRHKISRTALIVVGPVLNAREFDDSFLYRVDKAHIYRPRFRQRQKPSSPSLK